jgi:acyl-CoA synthetase (AMP-forming)/AMP-acid ligase II
MTSGPEGLLGWLEAPKARSGIAFYGGRSGWHEVDYVELASLVRRSASLLRASGVRRDDGVALVARTSPEVVATIFGALSIGARVTPIAPRMAFESVTSFGLRAKQIVRSAGCKVLAALEGDPMDPENRSTILDISSESIANFDEIEPERPGHLALVQLTSGASGRPKAVRVSSAALLANTGAIRGWMQNPREGSVTTWLPLYHDMGLIGTLITPIVAQLDLKVFEPEQFVRQPLAYLRALSGSQFSGMPVFALEHIVRKVRSHDVVDLDFSGFKALILGAERISISAVNAFASLLAGSGFERSAIVGGYGLAEATLAVTGTRFGKGLTSYKVRIDESAVSILNAGPESVSDRAIEVASCGEPLLGVGVELVSNGEPVGDLIVGELFVTGPSLADGYLDHVQEHRSSDLSGEVRRLQTGDFAFRYEGEYFILGRFGDAMKVRGVLVFAEVVELLLSEATPTVDEVVVVLGERDEQRTMLVLVVSSRAPDLDRLEEVLAVYRPDFEVKILPTKRRTIPRTTSGKPRRSEVWRAFVGADEK